MIALTVACGGGGETSPSISTRVVVATLTPAPPTPIPTATPDPSTVLRGFTYPVPSGCLPEGDQLMPNAPREYRQGTHEGVDFYDVDNCTPIARGTSVVAPKQGRVVRVDHDYVDPTSAQMSAWLADPTNEVVLDHLRGRQVWIDHGSGVVTRYCHLDTVAAGLKVDDVVGQGTLIGTIGESGTPESLTAPGSQFHLHWEVRVGDSFLGAGLPPAEVRALYLALFEP